MSEKLDALLPFEGTRETANFTLDLFDGKATLTGTVSERWDDVMVKTIKCGDKFKRTLVRRIGLSRSEKEEVDSAIKGSIGVSGLASLESSISAKIGVETRFEVVDEVQEEFTFASPQCGIRIIRLQQLQRLYRLEYRDTRAFKKDWQKPFVERVDRVHDAGISKKYDPDCDCEEKKDRDDDDGTFVIHLGRLTLRAAFSERNGFLYFRDLGARIPAPAARLEYATVRLKPGMLPPHVLFLAGLSDEPVIARFIPENVPSYVGQRTEATAQSEPEAEAPA